MDITMMDKTDTLAINQLEEIERIIEFAAQYLEVEDTSEMSITFMDNNSIKKINKEYRDKDMPTDVISFAMEELGEDELAVIFDEEFDLPRNIGDIMISVERAKEQASEYGHSFDRELGFLAVHGFLHLNGYDHMTPEDEKEMFDLQRKILNAYGLKR